MLTVFTPTYNRAGFLPRLYASLQRQTSHSFVWLVIDDGSTDETETLVSGWQKAQKAFQIRYMYKPNGGMHTAHNLAYDTIDTELNVCIDSDDYMPDDAVAVILDAWDEVQHDSIAGILGLDYDAQGKVIGTLFETDHMRTTLSGFYARGGKGDKKIVLRTGVVNKYPRYPEFPGEKLVPLGTLYALIDQDYELLAINRPLVIVDYQQGGSSKTILRQYRQSPRGFSYARRIYMRLGVTFAKRFIAAIHYVSSSIFEGNARFLSQSPAKLLTLMAFLPGLLLNLYIRSRTGYLKT